MASPPFHGIAEVCHCEPATLETALTASKTWLTLALQKFFLQSIVLGSKQPHCNATWEQVNIYVYHLFLTFGRGLLPSSRNEFRFPWSGLEVQRTRHRGRQTTSCKTKTRQSRAALVSDEVRKWVAATHLEFHLHTVAIPQVRWLHRPPQIDPADRGSTQAGRTQSRGASPRAADARPDSATDLPIGTRPSRPPSRSSGKCRKCTNLVQTLELLDRVDHLAAPRARFIHRCCRFPRSTPRTSGHTPQLNFSTLPWAIFTKHRTRRCRLLPVVFH